MPVPGKRWRRIRLLARYQSVQPSVGADPHPALIILTKGKNPAVAQASWALGDMVASLALGKGTHDGSMARAEPAFRRRAILSAFIRCALGGRDGEADADLRGADPKTVLAIL